MKITFLNRVGGEVFDMALSEVVYIRVDRRDLHRGTGNGLPDDGVYFNGGAVRYRCKGRVRTSSVCIGFAGE